MVSLYLRICSDNLSYNKSMQFSNSHSSTIFGIPVLLRFNCADHTIRRETFWLLIDFALRSFINRSARDIVFSILWKEKICGSRQSRAIKMTNLDGKVQTDKKMHKWQHAIGIYTCCRLQINIVKLRQDERVGKPVGKFARRTIREGVRVFENAATINIDTWRIY